MTRSRDTANTQDNIGGAVPPFVAGKNKIINGDFSVNQRAFTSTTTSATYGYDRFYLLANNGTSTMSAQTFTPGTAPVAGYEAANYVNVQSTGQTATNALTVLIQAIEDVRTLANQTVTVSFWAKASSGTPKVAVELLQGFGTGGSPSASVLNYAGQATLSTSWARYSVTVALPSISGKTLGTTANTSALYLNLWTSAGSDYNSRTGSIGIQTTTISFWGVQVEAGSVATPFQTATGTIQGELAACQRYYYRFTYGGANSNNICTGTGVSTTRTFQYLPTPVSMRTAPSLAYGGTPTVGDTATNTSVTNILYYSSTADNTQHTIDCRVASGITQFRPYFIVLTTAGQYIELSSEF